MFVKFINFNSGFLLGESLLFFYKEKWQSRMTSNFSAIVHKNILCIHNEQWIFMFGKFGNIIGAAWFSSVIERNYIEGILSTVNTGLKKDIWLELKFFELKLVIVKIS